MGAPREEVLRMDRWLHPRLPVHLPADVDLQAGVRRVRTLHRPPQVLLNSTVNHLGPAWAQLSTFQRCTRLCCLHIVCTQIVLKFFSSSRFWMKSVAGLHTNQFKFKLNKSISARK